MHYENNDKVFITLPNGKLCFGRVKLAREKVTQVPANSSTCHRFQVIWDDYRMMWQWLEEVETPLIVYDREFDVGDRVIYGSEQKATVRKVVEIATLLTDSKTVIENVKIKDVELISNIYPSAKIEYEGWIGEVMSVTRDILCHYEDGEQFVFQTNDPDVPSSKNKKNKKNDKNNESGKSRIAKLRDYPFHRENNCYFPGKPVKFSRKELKRFKWLKSDGVSMKLFKDFRKYSKKTVAVKSITISKLKVFWTGYIPFMLEMESPKVPYEEISGSDLTNVHALKPKELSSIDCKDYINFGHGSYFQYFLKESENQAQLDNWEPRFRAKFIESSENSGLYLDCNKNEINDESSVHSHRKKTDKPIRVEKIMSTRCYELKYWGEEKSVMLPGWKIQSDYKFYKVSTFKMGYPLVTKRFVFSEYGKLGVLYQKAVPEQNELKSANVMWMTLDPADGSSSLIGGTKESPYDLTYVVPPCTTIIGSVVYNSQDDSKFRYGIITQFDILDFGRVHVYDPTRGYSWKEINQLRSVHTLNPRRNCMLWVSSSIFRHDLTVDIGAIAHTMHSIHHLSLRTMNQETDFEIESLVTKKYNELDLLPTKHMFYEEEERRMKPKWQARVALEKKRLEIDLPDGIWVCGYKNRNELLSVAIEGNAGTILEDFLILMEVKIHDSFPKISVDNKIPYSIYVSNCYGPFLSWRKCTFEYIPDLSCDISPVTIMDWNVLTKWDPRTSTLVDVLTTMKAKLSDHLLKRVSEPGRMEINYNGLQTEYFICQSYNLALAIEILDSIHTSLHRCQPWLYFIRRYYNQAIPRIMSRYEKWNSLDTTKLNQQDSLDCETLPQYPFIPFSKDFYSSVMDRLVFLRDIVNNGKNPTISDALQRGIDPAVNPTLTEFTNKGFLSTCGKKIEADK